MQSPIEGKPKALRSHRGGKRRGFVRSEKTRNEIKPPSAGMKAKRVTDLPTYPRTYLPLEEAEGCDVPTDPRTSHWNAARQKVAKCLNEGNMKGTKKKNL